MSSFAGQSYLTVRSSVYMRSLYFQSLQSLPNWIQLPTSETSPVCASFQRINNKNTILSVTVFHWDNFSLSYFAVGKAAKTLHRMSPCTPVGVPAKITWLLYCRYALNVKEHVVSVFQQVCRTEIVWKSVLILLSCTNLRSDSVNLFCMETISPADFDLFEGVQGCGPSGILWNFNFMSASLVMFYYRKGYKTSVVRNCIYAYHHVRCPVAFKCSVFCQNCCVLLLNFYSPSEKGADLSLKKIAIIEICQCRIAPRAPHFWQEKSFWERTVSEFLIQ